MFWFCLIWMVAVVIVGGYLGGENLGHPLEGWNMVTSVGVIPAIALAPFLVWGAVS